MMIGVFLVRVPAADWRPAGWAPPTAEKKMVGTRQVPVGEAWRTKQFWLLWIVLCFNVTAGIGLLGQASAMIQEFFPGRVTAAAAAGFVGLLSLANMIGRFFWSSLSDRIGRKPTYMVFFTLGAIMYLAIPTSGGLGSVGLFVALCVVIISMYGGGFATIPAYLRDLFGTLQVGAIHGRLLTAWSTAGIIGPALINYLRQYQIARGVPSASAYNTSMYIMAALLVVGFIANSLVRPVDERGAAAARPLAA
jgi:MFS family permease